MARFTTKVKIIRKQLYIVIVFLLFISCRSSKNVMCKMVIPQNNNVEEFISFFFQLEKEYIDDKRDFVLINVNHQAGEIIDARIGILEQKLISKYRIGTHDNVYGFFEKDKVICIVFGDAASNLFRRSSVKKEISEFYTLKVHEELTNGIPTPPLNIEPVVWVYKYEKGEFVLKEKARVQLLN